MAKFFDDIGKDSNDLLSKDLPLSGAAKVTVETKNDSGVTLVATGRRYIKGKDSLVEATFEPTIDWSSQNVEIKGNFSSNSEYSKTVSVKDLGTKGTKLSLGAAQKVGNTTVTAGFSFKNENVAVKIADTYPINGDPMVFDGSFVGAYEKKIFVGLTSTYTMSSGDKPSAFLYGGKLGFDQPEFQGHVHARNAVKDKKDQMLLGAGWFHKISDVLKIGAGATFDTKNVQGPSVNLVADYKFDSSSSLRSKIGLQSHPDSSKPADLRLGFGLKQLFSKNATAIFGADLNARILAGQNSGDDHTFGVEIKFQ